MCCLTPRVRIIIRKHSLNKDEETSDEEENDEEPSSEPIHENMILVQTQTPTKEIVVTTSQVWIVILNREIEI